MRTRCVDDDQGRRAASEVCEEDQPHVYAGAFAAPAMIGDVKTASEQTVTCKFELVRDDARGAPLQMTRERLDMKRKPSEPATTKENDWGTEADRAECFRKAWAQQKRRVEGQPQSRPAVPQKPAPPC